MWFWEDEDTLIPREELAKTDFFQCHACAYVYSMWESIIEITGSVEYGERAIAAFALEQYFEQFKPDMSEISAAEWHDVQTVRAELARVEAQRVYNQRREMEAQRNKR